MVIRTKTDCHFGSLFLFVVQFGIANVNDRSEDNQYVIDFSSIQVFSSKQAFVHKFVIIILLTFINSSAILRPTRRVYRKHTG